MSIIVLVVDDHPVVFEGLQCFFRDTPITRCIHARDGEAALREFRRHRPHVVLLEPRLESGDGFELLEELLQFDKNAKVIIFSGHDSNTDIARSAALGAVEFLRKSATPAQIVQAIRLAHSGEANPDGSLLTQYRSNMRRTRVDSNADCPLTKRELQVVQHVAMGLSNREIAKSLEISIETVKEHVQNILRKLDVNDRTQAAVWAVRRDLA